VAKQTVSVPDIGGTEGAEIIEITVAVGDMIEEEQSLVVLETDKASMDIPSPLAGKVTAIKVKVGDKVSEGHLLLEVEVEGAGAAAVAEKDTAQAPEANQAAPAAPPAAGEVVVSVPDGAEGAEVIELCVAVGDSVEEGDSLVVLETDKASMEVPAPQAGKVVSFSLKQGDKTVEGGAILTLAVAGAVAESAPAKKATSEAPVAVSAATSSSEEVVKVPDGAEGAEVIEVIVAVGDEVAEGDSLIVLETDKASMEVPAPKAGKVVSLAVKQGDKTVEGGVILTLMVAGGSSAGVAPKTEAPAKSAPTVAASTPTAKPAASDATVIAASQSKDVYAGPAVRKFAREMAVDLTQVSGTVALGRICKEDVKVYVKQLMSGQKAAPSAAAAVVSGSGIPAIPAVDFSQFGEIDMLPMSKIKKLTAVNMSRNWLNIPHVTQFDDADITELEAFRQSLKAEAEKRGVKLTPLPFLLKACAAALVAEPSFNVSLHHDGQHIVQKKYVNIGIAVDSPIGLVVPVIRDVDKKGLWELGAEFMEIINKARDGKLGPKDMQGGCFTISSLGAMGGNGFTPIVNAPEVAILGVSRSQMKPVWNGKEFVPRNMLPLSLSYDHRAINGGDAGRFFTYLNSVIADIRRLLL
jgi:pyruvate dehydrogenase E2 component (dihydrolipoamide acetyltransferase)